MPKTFKIIYLITFISILTTEAYSQNVESVSFKDWFKYQGGLNLNSTAYTAVGMDNRRDPPLGVVFYYVENKK